MMASLRCLSWPVDTPCWGLLPLPHWETYLGRCKGGLSKVAWWWVACRDPDRETKWCNLWGSQESDANGMDRTHGQSWRRRMGLELRRDGHLHQLGKNTRRGANAWQLQRSQPKWGKLCTHQHWSHSKGTLASSTEMERWFVLGQDWCHLSACIRAAPLFYVKDQRDLISVRKALICGMSKSFWGAKP